MVYKRVTSGLRAEPPCITICWAPPGAVSLPPFLLTNHQVELHIRIYRLDLIRLHAAQTVEEVLSNLPLRSVFPAIVHGHHQRDPGFQNVFANDLFHLVSSFEELENSFSEEGGELMTRADLIKCLSSSYSQTTLQSIVVLLFLMKLSSFNCWNRAQLKLLNITFIMFLPLTRQNSPESGRSMERLPWRLSEEMRKGEEGIWQK